MKNVRTFQQPALLFGLLLFLVVSAAWQSSPSARKVPAGQFQSDTIKPVEHPAGKVGAGLKDLDAALKELETALKKLDGEMKQLDVEKLQREIKESLAKIDTKKLQEEIRASMSQVDWEKIRRQVGESLQHAERSLKHLDMSKLEKQMAEMQQHLGEQLKIDSERIQAEMQNAKKQMERARDEMKQLKTFIDALEKDGLIDHKKGYKIEVKDGELIINGIQQPKTVADKFRQYFKKDNFTIRMDGDTIIDL